MQIRLVYILTPLLFLHLYVSSNFAQQDHLAEAKGRISKTNNIIKEKGYSWKAGLTSMSILPKSALEKRCGIIPDSTFNPLKQKEYGEELYLEWKQSNDKKVQKTSSSINWRSWMSSVGDQGDCGNCWAYASTGVAEGLLHNLYGENIGIDLNEMEITNYASCAYGCTYENIDCGLSYIKNYEVESENHNQFPNRTKAFYSVATYSRQPESINSIQTALETSPVFATMSVFQDFVDYSGGIYEYTSGIYLGEHAIVIVNYGNDNGTDYWICKNSWGYNWGDNGYFLIKFGECGIDSYGDLVKATVNTNSLASFVPQFFNTINGAIQNSKSGEVTYVNTGTFNENVYNDKYDVGICGSGTNSTTINGTVTFSSADYSSLKDVAVNGKISVNNSNGIIIDNVKANHSNCYIDAYGSSVTINDYQSELAQTRGLYAHNGSSFFVYNSSFRNKYDGQHYEDTSYGENIVAVFCQNQTYDIVSFHNASVLNYWCAYSSPTEGSTVYGNVSWYGWYFCGLYKMAKDGSIVLLIKTNEDDSDYEEFKSAMAFYKVVRDKIENEIKECKKDAVENHTLELLEVVSRFKDFINKNNSSKYSSVLLVHISTIYGLLSMDEELISYMNSIALNKELSHLSPEAKNNILTLYYKRGENQKSIELSEQFKKEYPAHPLAVEWLYGQGLMYKYKMNDEARAEEIFSEVIDKYPSHGTAISAREHLNQGDIDLAKEQTVLSSEETELAIQNYPNPFNPTTTISYSIPAAGNVQIKIYDVLGRELAKLVDETKSAGRHTITWNGGNNASGIYFYTITFNNQTLYKKMLMIK